MAKLVILVLFLTIAGFLLYEYYLTTPYGKGYRQLPLSGKGQGMLLQSNAFDNNQNIPSLYTCDGENINPPLSITNVSADTQSMALIVDDPDSPTGDFTHWLLYNIPPTTEIITSNSIPSGASQGQNDFGQANYGGPCPGTGTHHYVFTLFALNTILNLQHGVKKSNLLNAMVNHIIGQTQLVGLYKRQ